ncbi:hypothetical protein TRVL_05829 [Trypanosoma vivax]|nr:hypothetical protein TRVL_05829 [Trypanosoma vivax]
MLYTLEALLAHKPMRTPTSSGYSVDYDGNTRRDIKKGTKFTVSAVQAIALPEEQIGQTTVDYETTTTTTTLIMIKTVVRLPVVVILAVVLLCGSGRRWLNG